MQETVEFTLKGISVPVFSAKHLAVIALQTGRSKDKARLQQFVEAGMMNMSKSQTILARHDLGAKWELFREQFLNE